MLILVCMLMRCLRNSGFDRRYMAEAALTMRDVMPREDEPSFVIKDPRYLTVVIEQNGDNQGTTHVDLSLYADAVFAKQWI